MLIPIICSPEKNTCFIDPQEVAAIGIDDKNIPYIRFKNGFNSLSLSPTIDIDLLTKTINDSLSNNVSA